MPHFAFQYNRVFTLVLLGNKRSDHVEMADEQQARPFPGRWNAGDDVGPVSVPRIDPTVYAVPLEMGGDHLRRSLLPRIESGSGPNQLLQQVFHGTPIIHEVPGEATGVSHALSDRGAECRR